MTVILQSQLNGTAHNKILNLKIKQIVPIVSIRNRSAKANTGCSS